MDQPDWAEVVRQMQATIDCLRNELFAKEARIAEAELERDTALTNTHDTIQYLRSDNEDLRAELAAKDARIAWLREHWGLDDIEAEFVALRKELAEANERLKQMYGLPYELAEAKRCRDNAEAALEVYDRTFPKKSELELHAALEAANAERDKWMEYATGDRAELALKMEAANADLAEAKAVIATAELCARNQTAGNDSGGGGRVVPELERWNAELTRTHNSYVVMNSRFEDRAERAEAECKALREALDNSQSLLVAMLVEQPWPIDEIEKQIAENRAALDFSKEG